MSLPVAGKFVPGGPGIFVVDTDGVETGDGAKLSSVLGAGPLIARLHSGSTGASASAATLPGPVAVPDSVDVGFVLRVATTTSLFTGSQLRSRARAIDGVTFSVSGGGLQVTGDGTDKAIGVWKLASMSVIRSAVAAAGGGSSGLDGIALAALQHVAYDLVAGGDATGWQDIASATVGGISYFPSANEPSAAQAAALIYSAPRIVVPVLPAGQHRHAVWRVPEDTAITHWRIAYQPRDSDYAVGHFFSGSWIKIGTLGGWDYYRLERPLNFGAGGVASIDLQTDSSAAHIGTSTFLGNVLLSKVFAALGLALSEASRGRLLQRKQDEAGLEYGPSLGYMPDAPTHADIAKQYALEMPPVSGAPNWRETVSDLPAMPDRTLATQILALRLPASTGDAAHRRLQGHLAHTEIDASPHRGVFEVGGKAYGFRAPDNNSAEFMEVTLASGVTRKIADVTVGATAPRGGMSDGTNHYVWVRHTDGKHYLNTITLAGALTRRTGGTGFTLAENTTELSNSGAILGGVGYFAVTRGTNSRQIYSVNLATGVATALGRAETLASSEQTPAGFITRGNVLEMAESGGPAITGRTARGGLRFYAVNPNDGTVTLTAVQHNVADSAHAYFGSGWMAYTFNGDTRFAQVVLTGPPASWERSIQLVANEGAYDAITAIDKSVLYLW